MVATSLDRDTRRTAWKGTTMQPEWMRWARALQAIAQSGLRYAEDPSFNGDQFDVERYRQVRQVAAEMMAAGTDIPLDRVVGAFDDQVGDATPNMDVRGAVFDGQARVLLVRERLDATGGRCGEDGPTSTSPRRRP